MGYFIEEPDSLATYTIKVRDGEIVRYAYIRAYSFSEACTKATEEGLEVID